MSEIKYCINYLVKHGLTKKKLTILHCNTEYPTPIKDINLNVILTLNKVFKCNVGFSDHSRSTIVPAASVALGSRIIEKHLTLNNNLSGPDHFASLNPKEFKTMVKNIREVEIALGVSKKQLTKSERKNINIVRKSIVAKKDIFKGELLTEKNITTKRPAGGISPLFWDKLLNKKSKRKYKIDQYIRK